MIQPPGIEAWDAWSPAELARRLVAVDVAWCVVGGWALDLWHGRVTRGHEDLEIAMPRASFAAIRATLVDHEVFVAGDGAVTYLPPDAPASREHHQHWVLDPVARAWRVDLMLEPGDPTTWIYRRDEAIRLPRSETVARTAEGIPYLRPELVLLFKAKAQRPKDEQDLAAALPSLDASARARLHTLLARVDPGHPWLARV